MKRSVIDLHIGELILRNVPYAQRHLVAATVEQELIRLLTEQGLPPPLAQGGNIPHISIGNLHLAADAQANAIGLQIAHAVYGHLTNDEAQH